MANNLEMIRAQLALEKQEDTKAADNTVAAKAANTGNVTININITPNGFRTYGVKEVMEQTGWSKKTVLDLFNDAGNEFASQKGFGKRMVIEETALIRYFAVKHEKERQEAA